MAVASPITNVCGDRLSGDRGKYSESGGGGGGGGCEFSIRMLGWSKWIGRCCPTCDMILGW
jgi:hypothetical protein